MQIIYAADEAGQLAAQDLICNTSEGIIVNFTQKTWCVCGAGRAFREDVCAERGIPVFHAHHLGGTTIVFPGDLSIMEIRNGFSTFGETCLRHIHDYLMRRGFFVRIEGNDLLIWDKQDQIIYKVGSHGSNHVGALTESVVHFSINVDVPLICDICTKPMIKMPGAWSKYHISAEELWAELGSSL